MMNKKKTKEVFVRLGMPDIVITKEEHDNEPNSNEETIPHDAYFIGYEDEEGEECDEDGTYLDQ